MRRAFHCPENEGGEQCPKNKSSMERNPNRCQCLGSLSAIRYSVMSDTQTALTTRTDAILHDLTSVYDVPVHITIDVGRLRLRVRDLLRLAPHSIIGLTKPAGQPLEITINGVKVARAAGINVEQRT